VVFIEKICRHLIQLVGFFMMSVFMLILGVNYDYLKNNNVKLFVVLYSLTFFFANFGPNSTTFMLRRSCNTPFGGVEYKNTPCGGY
jgi:PHS family inorganic phosphate transporter-like MFS transporter